MTHTTFTGRHLSEFIVGLASPLAAIAGYAFHVGASVGDVSTILAAVLTGALVPVIDRLLVKPALASIGLAADVVLQFAARATMNGAMGLTVAVWLVRPVS